MLNLSVEVDRHGIVVAEPGTDFSATYRREGSVLVADNLMQNPIQATRN